MISGRMRLRLIRFVLVDAEGEQIDFLMGISMVLLLVKSMDLILRPKISLKVTIQRQLFQITTSVTK
jgi:hypothetical protein